MPCELYTAEGAALLAHPDPQPWQTYPRPQLRRDSYLNLNGTWDFAVLPPDHSQPPQHYDRHILVPFAPESLLSGIHRHFPEGSCLCYRRTFRLPESFRQGRVLLHIGAADQTASVRLNGRQIGTHTGGYDPICMELTDALDTDNILEILVRDDLSTCVQPYGKQTQKRGGMWYTPVSGIWQTVWLECVPERYISALHISTGADWAVVDTGDANLDGTLQLTTPEGSVQVPLHRGRAELHLAHPRLWSPEDPYLYRFSLTAGADRVESYFALRTLQIRKINGLPRLCLNGKPYFFHGLLDQGYWSDGLFTPAAPECFARDIQAVKALGFQTLRKHIKVEPEQFYYDCDRLGMIVFQDMVNNGRYRFWRDTALPTVGLQRLSDRKRNRDPEARAAFRTAMEQTVRQLQNHPCICCWTIFNEGWGQFCGSEAYARLRELDDSRFIDTTSGWFRSCKTDVDSRHVYFKPVRLKSGELPLVLSEFGGYVYRVEGHIFNPDHTYGYRLFRDPEQYVRAVQALYREQILPSVSKGLCAAIYTQLSDVEDETNGILTYDRRHCKLRAEQMLPIARELQAALEQSI